MDNRTETTPTGAWHGPVDWRTELQKLSEADPVSECVLFRGLTVGGSGVLGGIAAHRFAYIVERGPIERSVIIRQMCGKPLCVNPLHLRTEAHSPVAKHPKTLPSAPASKRRALPGIRTTDADLEAGSLRRTTVGRLLAGESVRAVEAKRVQWLAVPITGEPWRILLYRNGVLTGPEQKPFDAVKYLMGRATIEPPKALQT